MKSRLAWAFVSAVAFYAGTVVAQDPVVHGRFDTRLEWTDIDDAATIIMHDDLAVSQNLTISVRHPGPLICANDGQFVADAGFPAAQEVSTWESLSLEPSFAEFTIPQGEYRAGWPANGSWVEVGVVGFHVAWDKERTPNQVARSYSVVAQGGRFSVVGDNPCATTDERPNESGQASITVKRKSPMLDEATPSKATPATDAFVPVLLIAATMAVRRRIL